MFHTLIVSVRNETEIVGSDSIRLNAATVINAACLLFLLHEIGIVLFIAASHVRVEEFFFWPIIVCDNVRSSAFFRDIAPFLATE